MAENNFEKNEIEAKIGNVTDEEIIKIAIKTLDNKLGNNLKVIKISGVSTIANYFILATGTSSTQVKTLADEVEQKLSEIGVTPRRTEGSRGSDWIALDYIDVIIHVFITEAREFYDLDRLWQDGEEIDTEMFLR